MLTPLAPSETRLLLGVLDERFCMYIVQLHYHFMGAVNIIGLGSHALKYKQPT